jgi:hypothetical protein
MGDDVATTPAEGAQAGVDDNVAHPPSEVSDAPPSVAGGAGEPQTGAAHDNLLVSATEKYVTFDRQLPPPLDPVSFGRDHAAVVDHLKAWVRREITLAVQYGMFDAERAEHNP